LTLVRVNWSQLTVLRLGVSDMLDVAPAPEMARAQASTALGHIESAGNSSKPRRRDEAVVTRPWLAQDSLI
jgi:hypothetical protein